MCLPATSHCGFYFGTGGGMMAGWRAIWILIANPPVDDRRREIAHPHFVAGVGGKSIEVR
jgi:hypothetical protein